MQNAVSGLASWRIGDIFKIRSSDIVWRWLNFDTKHFSCVLIKHFWLIRSLMCVSRFQHALIKHWGRWMATRTRRPFDWGNSDVDGLDVSRVWWRNSPTSGFATPPNIDKLESIYIYICILTESKINVWNKSISNMVIMLLLFFVGKTLCRCFFSIRWCTAQPRSFRSIKVKMAAAMPDPLATCMCSSFYSYRRYIRRSSRILVRCICSMDMNKQFYCGNSLLVTFLLVQNDCKSATVGHILS